MMISTHLLVAALALLTALCHGFSNPDADTTSAIKQPYDLAVSDADGLNAFKAAGAKPSHVDVFEDGSVGNYYAFDTDEFEATRQELLDQAEDSK